MAKDTNTIKGYIKTENTILLVILALAIGFVGGVIFSAYRWTGNAAQPNTQNFSQVQIPQEKLDQISHLNTEIKNNPQNTDIWDQLGHLYFDTGQFKNAIEAYERSLALDGNRPDIWTDLGVMYRRSGEPETAVAKFDQALKFNPNHKITLFNKGIVLMHDLKDPKGATDAWERLLVIDPNFTTPTGEPLSKMVEQLKLNAQMN